MSAFEVILHATDFSPESEQAFVLACDVARGQGARLVVVHVIPPSDCGAGDADLNLVNEDLPAVQSCREEFKRLQVQAHDLCLTFRIVAGYPVGMILNVARQEAADLIVIASKNDSHVRFQPYGSVADGVLRQAHCPVLCFRQPNASHLSGHPSK